MTTVTKLTGLASQSYSETDGTALVQTSTMSDAVEQASLTLAMATAGVNKGTTELELVNAAGVTVATIKGKYETNLTVNLTATEGASANNGSTSQAITWNVGLDAFGPGSKIKATFSGKIAKETVTGSGYASTISGSGHTVITYPFKAVSVEVIEGSDG
jgi:hypothetical protein